MSGELFFQKELMVNNLLELIKENKDLEIDKCRKENKLSSNQMARLYARARNHQKVAGHLIKHPKTVHQIARGYAEAGDFDKVEEYRTRYNVSLMEIIKGFQSGGHLEGVEKYRYKKYDYLGAGRIQVSVIDALKEYIVNENHEMVEEIRSKNNISKEVIIKFYAQHLVELPAELTLIDEESQKYAQELELVLTQSVEPQPQLFSPSPISVDMITGGIHTKYLTGSPHPRLPNTFKPQKNAVLLYNQLQFFPINEYNSTASAHYSWTLATPSFSATLYTHSQNIDLDTYRTFICAGRVQNAFAPPGKSILICTQTELENLLPYISSELNLLVVTKIESQFNGTYSQLGCVTARRLAAFLFAHYINCPQFMLLDDNIQNLSINPQSISSSSWDNVIDFLSINASQQASISVGTLMGRKKTPEALGSKLFYINMALIRERLKGEEEIFLLFPNAAQALKWGEDYYFQIVLHQLFAEQGRAGYGVVPIETLGLIRSKKEKNAFAASGKKAEHFHLVEQVSHYPQPLQHILESSIKRLNQIITDNYQTNGTVEEYIQQVDLSLLHAQANHQPRKLESVLKPINVSDSELQELANSFQLTSAEQFFKSSWMYMLNNYDFNSSKIRDYQADAIKTAAAYKQPSRLVMATGSGKSLIQSTWALMAYQASFLAQSVFIVTPHIDLVKQFYEDLLQYNDSLANTNDLLYVLPQNIVTVSSHPQSVSVNALIANKKFPQQRLILIFCEDSFKKFLDEAPHLVYKSSLILLDEYHYYSKTVEQLVGALPDKEVPMIIGSSATPPPIDVLTETLYTMSLEKALNGVFHAPLIAESLGMPFSPKNVNSVIKDLPRLLETRYHPGFNEGATLAETKGLIYLKSIELCKQAKEILCAAGINAYAIHSDNNQSYEETKAFVKSRKPGVLLAVRKLRFGFDCPDLGWEFILREPAKGNEKQDIEQMIGRVVRLYQDKIGLIVTFSDIHEKYIKPLINKQTKTISYSLDYLAQDVNENDDMLDLDINALPVPHDGTEPIKVSSNRSTLFSENHPHKRKIDEMTSLDVEMQTKQFQY